MNKIMQHYEKLVEFLGVVLGKNCEVALLDLSKDKQCITAIANGHISGRKIGAPATDLALRIIAQETWKTSDFMHNYVGVAKGSKKLKSSSYFIKEDGKLLGMLCFNIDLSEYKKLSEAILKLGGLETELSPVIESHKLVNQNEIFSENLSDIISNIFTEQLGIDYIPSEGLTQEKKLKIIKVLQENGVFLVKGAVFEVARRLHCSEPSVYRYLSMINKSAQTDNKAI